MWVLEQQRQRLRVRGGGGAAHVDRVRGDRLGREERPQPGGGLSDSAVSSSPAASHGVRGEDAEPARVRDHGDAAAAGSGMDESSAATSISSSSEVARITAAWWKRVDAGLGAASAAV